MRGGGGGGQLDVGLSAMSHVRRRRRLVLVVVAVVVELQGESWWTLSIRSHGTANHAGGLESRPRPGHVDKVLCQSKGGLGFIDIEKVGYNGEVSLFARRSTIEMQHAYLRPLYSAKWAKCELRFGLLGISTRKEMTAPSYLLDKIFSKPPNSRCNRKVPRSYNKRKNEMSVVLR